MSICDITEKQIGTMTLETRVYEDGYVQVTIMDQFGFEMDSLDGNVDDEYGLATVGHLESELLDQYVH